MDVVLIAGLWLPDSVWSDVVVELRDLGHRAIPVSLPGVDEKPSAATLEDQLVAALQVIDAAHRPLVVGHSAACSLAWLVADRRPDSLAGVALIGGFPASDGSVYADFFPIVDGVMAFPGWEPFEGPDSADLDEDQKAALAELAVPVPAGVASGVVHLGDERRFAVPVVLVCPEFSEAQAREWLNEGEVPELERAAKIEYVDIDSGHWPMVTQPHELARRLAATAETLGGDAQR